MSDVSNNKNPIIGKIEDKAKAMIKSDKIRDPQTSQEFLTRNTVRIIEKTFWFMGFILVLFVIVAVARPEMVEPTLPLFTLLLGGILALMGNNILNNRNSNVNT